MKLFSLVSALLFSLPVLSQSPEITSWIINTSGATGYNNIPSNVQQVQYSSNWVYVSCTCIPGYDIGPWVGNPNTPSNQNFLFKITRAPQVNTGVPVTTPMGHIGTWTNGVSIFNAKDGMSYNNQGIWNQNAIVVEGTSFDTCLGHPAPNGEYHHHLHPKCLYDVTDNSVHSPLIGYAFDGFPVYGAHAFANSNGTGSIVRMKSSYRLRNITTRTSLPDGTLLNPPQYGPAVSSFYPMGYYLEDYEYVAGLGDLDEHNGRFCVTPEYPAGTYAYFATVDSLLEGEYPYTIGPEYYGTVPPGNTGPGSGHNVISEAVTVYTPSSMNEVLTFNVRISPVPASDVILFTSDKEIHKTVILTALGEVLATVKSGSMNSLDVSVYPSGIYYLRLTLADGRSSVHRLIISR